MAAEGRIYPVNGVQKITLTWTSDGSGAATVTTPPLNGVLVRVVTDPGPAAPTANYDLVLNDEFGLDLFAGQGANRHTTSSEHFCPGVAFTDGTTTSVTPITTCGAAATLVVAAAGDTKSGTVVLFLV
jgi:hypothetical protein